MDILKMSDLQVSLIIIGIIIIAGVVVFNWMQQLSYRRKVEEAFEHKHDDVLLNPSAPNKNSERIEPKLNKAAIPELNEVMDVPADNQAGFADTEREHTFDQEREAEDDLSAICYTVIIQSESVLSSAQLYELLQHGSEYSKPVRWFGQLKAGEPWHELSSEVDTGECTCLQGFLQLVDRAGPVSEIELSKFRDMTQEFASQVNAAIDCPDIVDEYEQAVLLDKFCANVDIMIGINIISKDEGAFIGTKIRALAEASGFKLDTEGVFKYSDEDNVILFTLNNYETAPFLPESMKSLTTHGITFLLDVPRVANGEKVFDQMTHIAKLFSNTLGGIMVDDNRVPLSDNGIIRSRQQLNEIQEQMRSQNIPSGGNSAMRLFI